MLVRMKKLHIDFGKQYLTLKQGDRIYQLPISVVDKYRIDHLKEDPPISSRILFQSINKKYTKPGALLHGLRIRENLTQVEMAKKIKVTQSDISQMEKGSRRIGRNIAQRIQKAFGTDYRSFLD